MMKVQNIRNATFSSSNRLEKWIIPEEYKSKYILNGYVKQARAYKKIATIPVENTDMKKVLLENGEEYKIITFDKDYEDYLNAYKKGIKILTNWAIIGKKEKRYITQWTFALFCHIRRDWNMRSMKSARARKSIPE